MQTHNNKKIVRCFFAVIFGLMVLSLASPAYAMSNSSSMTVKPTKSYNSAILNEADGSSYLLSSGIPQNSDSPQGVMTTHGSTAQIPKTNDKAQSSSSFEQVPETKFFRSDRGLIFESWYNGELVKTACIPLDLLIKCYGSRIAAENALKSYPKYEMKGPDAPIEINPTLITRNEGFNNSEIDQESISLDSFGGGANYFWKTIETRDLGAQWTKVTEIHSSPGLQVDMKLKFTSTTDSVYSIDGGVLHYQSGHQSEAQTTKTYSVSNGDARTIFYKYEYQYLHQEEWYVFESLMIKLEDKETWGATDFFDMSGMQSTPIPVSRTKVTPDNYLDLSALGTPGDSATTEFVDLSYTSWEAGAAVTIAPELGKPWGKYQGDITFGISTELNHYQSAEVVYEFQNLLSQSYEWPVYYWGSSGGSGDGYVLSFGPRNTGGGCPYISSWNGISYTHDNNILPESETSNCQDVIDNYVLQNSIYTDSPHDPYRVRIEEFEHEHSWIDSITMSVVGHPYDTNLAVSPDGQIRTFTRPLSPISAEGSDGNDYTQVLASLDGMYFHGYSDDSVVVTFMKPENATNLKLVMLADMKSQTSIDIQIPSTEGWATYAVIHPRELWAYELVDLSEIGRTWNDQITVRLLWTAEHKLDFIGLDSSPNAPLQIQSIPLMSAIDSQGNNVLNNLKRTDMKYVELVPNDFIDLAFQQKSFSGVVNDIVIHSVGHYLPIDNMGNTNINIAESPVNLYCLISEQTEVG